MPAWWTPMQTPPAPKAPKAVCNSRGKPMHPPCERPAELGIAAAAHALNVPVPEGTSRERPPRDDIRTENCHRARNETDADGTDDALRQITRGLHLVRHEPAR